MQAPSGDFWCRSNGLKGSSGASAIKSRKALLFFDLHREFG